MSRVIVLAVVFVLAGCSSPSATTTGSAKSGLDLAQIYKEAESDFPKASAAYHNKKLTVRGVVNETAVTGFGLLVWFKYKTEKHYHFQDRISTAFVPNADWDMGFNLNLSGPPGTVGFPWKDGDTLTMTGTILVEQEAGNPKIGILRAHLD